MPVGLGGQALFPQFLLLPRQFMRSTQQEGAILGVAGLIEPEHGEFVAGGSGAAVEEVLDGAAEGVGDAADVVAQLAGAVGFPLGYGAAAYFAGGGELILGEAAGAPQLADAHADGGERLVHRASMRYRV